MREKKCEEVVIYHGKDDIRLEVLSDGDTVWLNRQQLSMLFGRDVKTIGKHIANALREELEGYSVVAKFATTASDGKTYQVEYYSLDLIFSVGYRVKSKEGIRFRRWANGVLKAQLMRRATDSRLLKELERRFSDHEIRLTDVEHAMRQVLDTLLPAVTKNAEPIGFKP